MLISEAINKLVDALDQQDDYSMLMEEGVDTK